MLKRIERERLHVFLEVLDGLKTATRGGAPQHVSASLAYLADRAKGFSGDSLTELAAYLAPPLDADAPSEIVEVDVEAVIGTLRAVSKSSIEFNALVDRLSEAHTAPVIKEIAARYAGEKKPKTKTDAVAMLKGARATPARAAPFDPAPTEATPA